jgi:hypothetical protein
MRTLLTLGLLLAFAAPAVAHADEAGAEPKSTDSTASAETAAPAPVEPALPATKSAPPLPAPVEPAATPAPAWYGTETLLVDAAALGLLIVGASVGGATRDTKVSEAFALAGLGTYVLGGPIVHLAHDRPYAALGSLGLRVGAPVVAGFVGMAIEQSSCSPGTWFCGLAGLLLGGTVGVIGAVAIDSAAIAWAPRTQLTVVPMVGGGRLGVNLGGTF